MRAPDEEPSAGSAGPDAAEGESGLTRPETPSPSPPADEAIEHDLEELLSQRDEYLDLAKRTKADFENFRKRMAADVQAAAARGKAEVASGLIDAVDNLERALEAKGIDPATDPLGDEQASDAALDSFDHGVVLVLNGMRETLRRNGVEPVDPRGEKFDPNLHEALSKQPADGAEAGTVIETMQKGYRLGDQLIRPARVVVAE